MTVSRPARRIRWMGTLVVVLAATSGCTSGVLPSETPGVRETSHASRDAETAAGDEEAPAGQRGDGGTAADGGGGADADDGGGGADADDEAGSGMAGVPDRAASLVVRPEGFTSASAFPPRAGWTPLGSSGRCTVSSTGTSVPDEDQAAGERAVSLVSLADLLAGEPRASAVSSVSEVLVTDGNPGEPRGTNAVLQEWTVERAGTLVRSRVLVRTVWTRLYSGEGLRESSYVAFECAGTAIDEAAWGAALAQVRLPLGGGEATGTWRFR